MTVPGANRQDMRYGVVAEGHIRIVDRHSERNVRSTRHAVLTVIHIPAFVERHLAFVATFRKGSSLKRMNAITIRVLQPRAQTIWLPVARAAQLRLETARGNGDHRILVIC